LAYSDDDRYKELEDWEKWTYYHFWVGDKHFRIPKPFETGVITSSAWEAAGNVLKGNEELSHIWKFTLQTLMDTFAFNPVPQLIKPITEQIFNFNMFTGRPIESTAMQRLPAGMRSDPWGSPSLKALGESLGVSPKRAQALIDGYFSTFGVMALGITDAMFRQFADLPEAPTKRLDEYPMVGRFVKDSENAHNTKHMMRFYEISKEADKLVAAVKQLADVGRVEEARDLIKKNEKLYLINKLTDKAGQSLTKINEMIRQVWLSRTLTADEKRTQLDELSSRRNKLVQRVTEIYGGTVK
jgi:hypothetical protein